MRYTARENGVWRVLPRIFFATLALLAIGCRAQKSIASKDVSFTAADEVAVHATLYIPDTTPAPAMLLLHMMGSDRHAWDRFAQHAARRGFLVLAMDLRGHGDTATGAKPGLSFGGLAALPSNKVLGDIGLGINYLLDNGADPENLIVCGASIGANLALRYAATDPRIQAAVLLSPGEEYRGVTVLPELNAYTKRPLLILATEGDSHSAATARKMKSVTANYCELRLYPGSAHGTDILDSTRPATGQIFLWLDPILNTPGKESKTTP